MKPFARLKFLTVIACCVPLIPLISAPVQWPVSAGGNGHSYEVFSVFGGITWTAAQNAAVSRGGYLATLTSAAENAFVFALVDDPIYWTYGPGNTQGPWIGGFQPDGSPEPDGGWQWLNGDGSFSNASWADYEPNNGGGNAAENKLCFWHSAPGVIGPTWNDLPDDPQASNSGTIIAYVVEYNPLQIQSPQLSGNMFNFGVQTFSNLSYTVQYNDHLATTNWLLCTNFIGDGSLRQIAITMTNSQRFFRVSQH